MKLRCWSAKIHADGRTWVVNSEWANGAMISRNAAVARDSETDLATADVEDVLQPGEARTDKPGVDQAVGQRVSARCGASLSSSTAGTAPWRPPRSAVRRGTTDTGTDRLGLAGIDRRFQRQLQDRRDDDSHGRAPRGRRGRATAAGSGSPPVEPQIGEHDNRHRHAGHSAKPDTGGRRDWPRSAPITISPVTVPSTMITPIGAPTLRIRRGSPG